MTADELEALLAKTAETDHLVQTLGAVVLRNGPFLVAALRGMQIVDAVAGEQPADLDERLLGIAKAVLDFRAARGGAKP